MKTLHQIIRTGRVATEKETAMFTLTLSKTALAAAYAATVLGSAVAFNVAATTEAAANSKCGGLNQRVCKKWEQLRGCDKGLHRTSPIGGICTRDNKLIPDVIENIFKPQPIQRPQPKPEPIVIAPPHMPGPPVLPGPPAQKKKGALPHVSAVAPTQPTAMDGIYKLAANGVPYKLEAGRLYAMAEYKHLFVFPVEAYDVVVKDIVQTGPGQLSGNDLALLGPWTATMTQGGGITISVQGALGPFTSTMTPVQLDNPDWFAQEMASMSGEGYDAYPQPQPYPQPYPQPQPDLGGWPAPEQPGAGDYTGYPPGWGG